MTMLEQIIERWLSKPASSSRGIHSVADFPMVLATDLGLKRNENQDRIAALRVHGGHPSSKSFTCVAVCDGMGGMSNGSACATLTLASFLSALVYNRHTPPLDRLNTAARFANQKVFDFAAGKGGATLSAVLLEAGDAYSANVGDSRIYFEAAEGNERRLQRATVDDNLAEAFGGNGRELVQFVGIGEGISPHVSSLSKHAESFIITTDGAHFIDEGIFSTIFLNSSTVLQAVERLVAVARWLGGPDNATLAAFKRDLLHQAPAPIEEAIIELWGAFDSLQLMSMPPDGKSSVTVELLDKWAKKEAKVENQTPSQQPKKGQRKTKKKQADQLEIDIKLGDGGQDDVDRG